MGLCWSGERWLERQIGGGEEANGDDCRGKTAMQGKSRGKGGWWEDAGE
jgi:hypothetical protein